VLKSDWLNVGVVSALKIREAAVRHIIRDATGKRGQAAGYREWVRAVARLSHVTATPHQAAGIIGFARAKSTSLK
jgi:hypothetical protein